MILVGPFQLGIFYDSMTQPLNSSAGHSGSCPMFREDDACLGATSTNIFWKVLASNVILNCCCFKLYLATNFQNMNGVVSVNLLY